MVTEKTFLLLTFFKMPSELELGGFTLSKLEARKLGTTVLAKTRRKDTLR